MSILSQVVNAAIENGAPVVKNRNACRLEGWTHGHLDAQVVCDAFGYRVVSNCGKVNIRVSGEIIHSRFGESDKPTFFYE